MSRKRVKINFGLLSVILLGPPLALGGAYWLWKSRTADIAQGSLEAARAHAKAGNWKEAAKDYKNYLSRFREDAAVWEEFANSCVEARPIELDPLLQAINAYKVLLRENPSHVGAMRGLTEVEGRMFADFGEAEFYARSWAKQAPNDPLPRLWLGRALMELGRVEEAVQTLNTLLGDPSLACPQRVDGAILLAMTELSRKPMEQGPSRALSTLDAAVAACPDSGRALAYRGWLKVGKLQDVESGLKDLDLAENRSAGDPLTLLKVLQAWLIDGREEAARGVMSKLRTLDPMERKRLIREQPLEDLLGDDLSWELSLLKAEKEIAMVFGDAAEQARLADRGLNALKGDATLARQFLPLAIELCCAAAEGSGEGVPPRETLIEKAESCARLYREGIDPSDPEVQKEFDRATRNDLFLSQIKNEPGQVIRLASDLMLRYPKDAGLGLQKAWGHRSLGQYEQELATLQAVLQSSAKPGDPGILSRVIDLLEQSGGWREAAGYAEELAAVPGQEAAGQTASLLIRAGLALQSDDVEAEAAVRELLPQVERLLAQESGRIDLRLTAARLHRRLGDKAAWERILTEGLQADSVPLRVELIRGFAADQRVDEALSQAAELKAKQPDEPVGYLLSAELHLGRRDWDKAREDYDAALAHLTMSDAGYRDILQQRLITEIESSGLRAGSDYLRKRLEETPADLDAAGLWVELHLAYRDDSAIDTSDAEMETLLPRFEKSDDANRQAEGLYYQARFKWPKGMGTAEAWNGVLALLERARNLRPQSALMARWLARAHEHLGKIEGPSHLESAESILRDAKQRNPGDPRVEEDLIRVLMERGEWVEVDILLEGRNLKGGDLFRSRLLAELGQLDFDQAIRRLKQRILLDPTLVEERLLLAALLYEAGHDAAGALEQLDKVDELEGAKQRTHFMRVRILETEGRIQEAERLCDEEVSRTGEPNALRVRADFLSRQGKMPEAEADYRALAAEDREGRGGILLLARFLEQTGRRSEALQLLSSRLAEHPEQAEVARLSVEISLLNGEPESIKAAIARLGPLRVQFPEDPSLMVLDAVSLLPPFGEPTGEHVARAETLLRAAIARNPQAEAAQLRLISLLAGLGRREEALAACDFAIRDNPARPDLKLARAELQRAGGDPIAAERTAQEIVQWYPRHLGGLLFLADLYQETGQLKEALDMAQRAAAQAPERPDVVAKEAAVLRMMERLEDAVALITKHYDSAPQDARAMYAAMLADLERQRFAQGKESSLEKAWHWFAQADSATIRPQRLFELQVTLLSTESRLDEVAQALSKHLQTSADDLEGLRFAAVVLKSDGAPRHLPLIREALERVVEAQPGDYVAWVHLAETCYRLGDLDRAEEGYRKAMDGGAPEQRLIATNGVAWILFERGKDLPAALELADRALAQARQEKAAAHLLASILDTRGNILLGLGRFRGAAADFEACVEAGGTDPTARCRALAKWGQALIRDGQAQEGRAKLEEALAIHREQPSLSENEMLEVQGLLNAR